MVNRNWLEVTIDALGDNPIPSFSDLLKYNIEAINVLVNGPAGGNPYLTINFGGIDPRTSAIRFLTEWYGADPKGITSDPPEFFIDGDGYTPGPEYVGR